MNDSAHIPADSDIENTDTEDDEATSTGDAAEGALKRQQNKEIGGFEGPEPTRYGDWEKNGRCVDF